MIVRTLMHARSNWAPASLAVIVATIVCGAFAPAGAIGARQLPGAPLQQTQPPRPSGAASVTPGKSVIIGTVSEARTGRGVANAVVRLTGPSGGQTRLTDPKGRFYFKDLGPGQFNVTVEKNGFLDGAYGKRRPTGTGMPLTLYEGQWISDMKIDLWRPATITGVVVDEINEPVVGVPVSALRRQFVAGRLSLTPSTGAVTDDLGEFRIAGLVPGDYLVATRALQASVPLTTVAAIAAGAGVPGDITTLLNMNNGLNSAAGGRSGVPDLAFDDSGRNLLLTGRSAFAPPPVNGASFIYPTLYYPGVVDVSTAQSVTVDSGEERRAISLQISPVAAARVSGVVAGSVGALSGLVIRLLPSGAEDLGIGTETALTIAAADGTFILPSVPVGDYTLEARWMTPNLATTSPDLRGSAVQMSAATLAMVTPNWSPPSRASWGQTTVSVIDRDVTDVRVTLQPGTTITGRVAFSGNQPAPTAAQLSRIVITAVPASGATSPNTFSGRTAVDGRFSMTDVMPGEYFVRVGTAPPGWTLESAMSNSRDVSDVVLNAQPGDDVDDLVVTFTDRPTQIMGTVRDARGSPLTSSTVIVFPADRQLMTQHGSSPRRLRNVRAPGNGVFTISGLPAGDYLLVAINEADADNWQDPQRLEAWRTVATTLTLRDAEQKTQDLRVVSKR